MGPIPHSRPSNNRGTYWAGFSHALGTRTVMDWIIADAMPGCSTEWPCHDLESEGSWLGRLMRQGGWYRGCHKATHDSPLWRHMSEAFSFMQQEKLAAAQNEE